ncbi:MAG: response regulator [Reichenbachiella sp.]
MRLLNYQKQLKKTILLVDDNNVMCKLLSRILQKDYNVHCCKSAIEAINWLSTSNNTPDVVVSDITMSGMNGIEFGQYLNINELYGQIPLIFMSGNSEEDLQAQLSSVNYSGYARKPFSPDTLLKSIEAVA